MDKGKLILGCIAGVALAVSSMFLLGQNTAVAQQDRTTVQQGTDKTDTSQADMKTKSLWEQIGKLHAQIVAIELKDSGAGASSGTRTETSDAATTGRSDDTQRSGDRSKSGTTVAGADAQESELWMQFAKVHKQLVHKLATEGVSRTAFFRGAQGGADAADAAGNAAQGDVTMDPLWQRYFQLQHDIIANDVMKQKGGSSTESGSQGQGRTDSPNRSSDR